MQPFTTPRAGDEEFARQLEEARPSVVRWARGYQCREAEDVAQEVLVRAWAYRATYRGPTLATWLRRILLNLLFDRSRPRTRGRHAGGNRDVCWDAADLAHLAEQLQRRHPREETDDPAELLLRECVGERLSLALSSVPAGTLMMLQDLADGIGYAELSARYNIPIGTVKSRLNRARVVVKEKLIDDGGAE